MSIRDQTDHMSVEDYKKIKLNVSKYLLLLLLLMMMMMIMMMMMMLVVVVMMMVSMVMTVMMMVVMMMTMLMMLLMLMVMMVMVVVVMMMVVMMMMMMTTIKKTVRVKTSVLVVMRLILVLSAAPQMNAARTHVANINIIVHSALAQSPSWRTAGWQWVALWAMMGPYGNFFNDHPFIIHLPAKCWCLRGQQGLTPYHPHI